jgi:hypothetical protein
MLRYRELLVVERLFRTTKDLLATRPIYPAFLTVGEMFGRCRSGGMRRCTGR